MEQHMHSAWIYIMTNERNTTLYVGVTTRIFDRMREHKTSRNPRSFTAQYKLFKLVYYEGYPMPVDAIARENYLKAKSRKFKEGLIDQFNPEWKDLSETTRDL